LQPYSICCIVSGVREERQKETPMEYEANAKRLAGLTGRLIGAHAVILGILGRLPIPLTAARYQDGEPDGMHPAFALYRASELMEWQPVGSLLMIHVRDMITEWLTAYELATLAQDHGPYTWRLDGTDAALARLQVKALLAEEQLYLLNLKDR
jgi:hypothetical protein